MPGINHHLRGRVGSGPKTSLLADLVKFGLLLALLYGLARQGLEGLSYNWQWYRIPAFFWTFEEGRLIAGPFVSGLLVTLRITALSLVLASGAALVTALFRLSGSPLARLAARGYLELIRNTPLLIQIFFIYFVLAPILDMGSFAAAVLALALFEGAYASEILRAGIVSIERGQWEASASLGLGEYATYRHIILPQAIPRVLPPLTGQAISLIKDSALVSTIAIYDLTMQGQAVVSETYLTFEVWFTIAAVYLSITVSLSLAVKAMEKRARVEA